MENNKRQRETDEERGEPSRPVRRRVDVLESRADSMRDKMSKMRIDDDRARP